MSGDVLSAFYQETSSETAVDADEYDLHSLMLMYQLQAEQFKEDFEHERQDHQRTKAQVQSLTIQWSNLHDELRQCQAKVRCAIDVAPAPVAAPDFCEWGSQRVSKTGQATNICGS